MSDEIKVKGNSGKIKVVIAVMAVIIVALVVAVVLLLPKGGTAKKVAKQLSLGAKYLSELEYEQAIAAYELAIEIDPKCVDAYLELADIYSELGEYDKAEKILKKAKREVAEEEVAQIRRKQEKIEKKRKEAEGNPEPTKEPKPTAEPVQTPEPTATQTPEPTATPTPTPEPTKSVGSRVTITGRTVELENASVGDYVTFGTYEQDNNLENGAEAIEWLVLDKQDGKVLLLSKYALDAKPYNETDTAVTWETCSLRSWLNSEFYRTAFSEKERTSIAETLVRNADNPVYGTEGGNDTRDKVFLLSIGEETTYFDSNPDAEDPARRAKVTEYAKAQGGWAYNEDKYGYYETTEYDGNGWWWLRSPGGVSSYAADVVVIGHVYQNGRDVDVNYDVVRPALWIALSDTTVTPLPTATPAPTQSGSLTSVQAISKASVGDYVTFGTYEQDNNLGNGAEAIEWLVLDKQDGKVLLLSKYALDAKPYNETNTGVTWETCTLRSWLNSEFYRTAFSEKERSAIAETLVRNADNPYFGTEGGNDTRDKVFLLSIGEAMTYFDSDPDAYDPARRAKVTEYAKARGGLAYSEAEHGGYGTTEYDGNGWWWLRSPGNHSGSAATVYLNGNVGRYGDFVDDGSSVVRPALWIALSDTTVTPLPTATPAPTQSGSLTSVQAISKASVGDYVTFGTYEQDNNLGNGAEAIEWLVLDKQDGKVLLLSKYALDCKKYNETNTAVTWETCTLRSWLNSEFYRTAFSEKERGSIAETLVRNADNPEYGTEGGNDTRDKVFLLSIGEATNYFDSNPARRAKVTEYAKAQGGLYSTSDEYYGNGSWWLRSPGNVSYFAASVCIDGIVSQYGSYVGYGNYAVRPALWITP